MELQVCSDHRPVLFPRVAEIARCIARDKVAPQLHLPQALLLTLGRLPLAEGQRCRFLGQGTIWSEAPSEAMLCSLSICPCFCVGWEAAKAQPHCCRRGGDQCLNTALLWALELASAWEINTVPFTSEGLCLAELNSRDCHPGNESLGDLHLKHHNGGRAFQLVRRVQRPQHKTFPLSREHCHKTKNQNQGQKSPTA